MCLDIAITAPFGQRDKLEALSGKIDRAILRLQVQRPSRWPWATERLTRVTISEEGGCACSLLSDEADWNADVWAMRADILERLAATVKAVAAVVPDGLALEALWAGDAPNQTVHIDARDLAALAASSRLGTRTRYEIMGG